MSISTLDKNHPLWYSIRVEGVQTLTLTTNSLGSFENTPRIDARYTNGLPPTWEESETIRTPGDLWCSKVCGLFLSGENMLTVAGSR